MLNFIHIPKTAGTSFRVAATNFFGEQYVLKDYGKDSEVTSDLCLKFCYGNLEDRWSMISSAEEVGVKIISGHFRADKYLPAISIVDTITFIRDPVQRLVSEYEHFIRHNNYKEDFKVFYNLPVMRNRYSKILHGVPLRAIGFVGLTEQYETSLKMLNELMSTDIKLLEENLGKKKVNIKHDIYHKHEEEIRSLNSQDYLFYDQAVKLFEQRKSLFVNRQPFVHGAVVTRGSRQISGWAWVRSSDKPVVVDVFAGEKQVGTSVATEFRPNLCRFGVPRAGYVGWTASVDLVDGEFVECRVSDTGQVLGAYTHISSISNCV